MVFPDKRSSLSSCCTAGWHVHAKLLLVRYQDYHHDSNSLAYPHRRGYHGRAYTHCRVCLALTPGDR